LWNNGNTTQIISNILAGTYTLTVTDANGCREINISTLSANIKPYADFSSASAISCEGVHLAFMDASTDAITWDWAFGNSGSSTMQNPEFVFPYNGTYNVTLIVTNPPCADTVSKPVLFSDISDYFSIAQTNVFTPNADGTNDCFRPGFAGIGADTANLNDCIEFEVFDRWGVKMFKSAEADNCWHGNNLKNSTPAVEGTYFYIAKLGKITSKGYVTLLRNR
jgi:gliding motility-associated-like protein